MKSLSRVQDDHYRTSKMQAKQKLREEFLKEFVITLINNSISEEEKIKIRQLKTSEQIKKIITIPKKIVSLQPSAFTQVAQAPKRRPFIPQTRQLTPLLQTPIPPPVIRSFIEDTQAINLGKIVPFLKDPSVISVECPGPEKHILVNRAGAIQTTPVVLTSDELNAIMEEISQNTRLLLISGLFKALIKDLIVIAVISDFIGTRFIIQKRTPFQRY